MKNNNTLPSRSLPVLAVILILAGLILSFDTALAQYEPPMGPDDPCVQYYQPGAVCTANDVRIERMRILTLIDGCTGPTDTLTADFEILISAAGSPDRYDIGLFIASYGGSALTGNACYHDFLEPPSSTSPTYGDYDPDGPDGPDFILDLVRDYSMETNTRFDSWWDGDGDSCGDMGQNTQVFKVNETLTVGCNDGDGDGVADIHVCSSWDNNASTTCTDVQTAFPGTKSKCGCQYVPLGFTPTNIILTDFAAHNQQFPGLLPISLLAIVGIILVGFFLWRNTKNRQGSEGT